MLSLSALPIRRAFAKFDYIEVKRILTIDSSASLAHSVSAQVLAVISSSKRRNGGSSLARCGNEGR